MTKVEELAFDIVHHTQEIYRKVLDCMARPGKINGIQNSLIGIEDLPQISKPLLGLAYTLLDREVNFRVITDGCHKIETYMTRKTYSLPAYQNDVDYLFIETTLTDEEIIHVMDEVKIGTLEDPHLSTTILMKVDSLSSSYLETGQRLTLKGPGIQTEKTIYISGLSAKWLLERKRINHEFPLGIDMILVDKNGSVVAFPRTTIIESECV